MLFESIAGQVVDLSYFQWIEEQETARLVYLQKVEDYYEGETEIPFPDEVKEAISAELGFNGNICRSVVDASVHFLSKAPLNLEIKVPKKEVNESNKEVMDTNREAAEEFIIKIFRDSKLLIKNFIKAIRIQGKKGNFALKAYPVLKMGSVVSYRISVLSPDICYPRWSDENADELHSFGIKYRRRNSETGEQEDYAEIHEPGYIWQWRKPIDGKKSEWELIDQGPTGYDFIPIEWVNNRSDETVDMLSDITSEIMDLQDSLNRTLTDMNKSSMYEAFREVFLLGGELPRDPKTGETLEIIRGPGKVHAIKGQGLGDGSNPTMIVVEGANFDGYIKLVDKYLDIVSVMSKVPKNELARGTSGATSGLAIEEVYQPFIGKNNEKAMLAIDGFESIATKVLLMVRADNLAVDFDREINYIVNAHIERRLPKSDLEQAQIKSSKINDKIMSRKRAMQQDGVEDTEAEQQQILEEQALYNSDLYSMRSERDVEDLRQPPEDVGGVDGQ